MVEYCPNYSLFLYRLLAGVPGVARDEKLRKQIFEITWRDKGWIGYTLFVQLQFLSHFLPV